MIIDCLSDLHGHLPETEGGDILIVAGDLTARDEHDQYIKFYSWLHKQKYKHYVFIAGNHDMLIEKDEVLTTQLADTTYLCDSGAEIMGLKFWGSPWTSQFPGINPKCCAFTREFMKPLKDRWDLIPDDVDVLITHTPPSGIFDQVARDYNANVGDMNLLETLSQRIKPKLHVFGHIHENGGKQLVFKRPGYGTENNTICVNASLVNEHYQMVNYPIRITL